MNAMNDDAMRRCIAACQECHATCAATIVHCLMRGGAHADPGHVRLMLDCADMARTSADFMLRGSERHVLTCGVCAEICAACAADCARLAGDDPRMRACAEACRRCAESCREMAA